jgi:eukaryotic-like serine/threonine-protein kinase
MDEPGKKCAECGAALAEDARGLCPRCLLLAGFASEPDPEATVAGPGRTGTARAQPRLGDTFGPYRILRQLGEGGMGVVFEAEEQETGRRVALKVIGRQFDSLRDRTRFLREGRLAASINHPNSVYVFGTEEIAGTPTIAMELVSGGTLSDRVKNSGPMPVSAAVDAILQIIAGLEAAQAIGILHRDVKPGNCFEDADGTVKIGDFGLSISTAARAEATVTAPGTMIGTPAFCSPEQLRGDELNARSDMYSVGGTLFYLLTGRVPFEGHNLAQLTANVLEKPAPSPRDIRKEIPKGLANVVVRCLAKQPGDRFKTYDDLRQALAPYASASPTPATLSLRFFAGLLDMIILSVIGTFLFFPFFGNSIDWLDVISERSPRAYAIIVWGFLASLAYYVLFEGLWGATAGKAICGLRVVRPDRSPPGLGRAVIRFLIYVILPALPYWLLCGHSPKELLQSSALMQLVISNAMYVVIALLFSTVRRRNGYAAVHDLVTGTRVISRTSLASRPLLSASAGAPPTTEGSPTVGPYHVLDVIETTADGKWLLGYDLRLLRRVWIHTQPPGTPSLSATLRRVTRVGRLRWLSARRSTAENWDAFEGVGGRSLQSLVQNPQSWRKVRFWIYDLARELAAAEKDSTLPPVLALNRVWITDDGRAKLLDFPAPGSSLPDPGAAAAGSPSAGQSQSERCRNFLTQVATAALNGRPNEKARGSGKLAARLPLHARNFLKKLPELASADAVARATEPLLRRITAVSRWRRAAIVAGCLAIPALAAAVMLFSMSMLRDWQKVNPGVIELSTLLQARYEAARAPKLRSVDPQVPAEDGWILVKAVPKSSRPSFGFYRGPAREVHVIPDRQMAVFIASHYRSVIENESAWHSVLAMSLLQGEARRFAERSLVEHPNPTKVETSDADAAIKPNMPDPAEFDPSWGATMLVTLIAYLFVPTVISAIAFRGGLILRIADVTFIRRDGAPASRLRMLWRTLMAWSPLLVLLFGPGQRLFGPDDTRIPESVPLLIFGALAVLSVLLPTRGLPDRLAGTWPVPR